jgi:hypothetical protein
MHVAHLTYTVEKQLFLLVKVRFTAADAAQGGKTVSYDILLAQERFKS